MNVDAPFSIDCDAVLSELAAIGLRAARVVAGMIETEGQVAALVGSWLPAEAGPAVSLEAVAVGQRIDAADAAMAAGVPRVEVLARALERVSRSVRRSVALLRRMQAGWPRAGSDDRRAMVRRQVARGVSEVIRRERRGEAAERLFDELAERLDEPGVELELDALPVAEVVRRICRDLGLAGRAVEGLGGAGAIDSG